MRPICLWCRDTVDADHSPDDCRAQILEQDEPHEDPAMAALRATLREPPRAPGAPTERDRGA